MPALQVTPKKKNHPEIVTYVHNRPINTQLSENNQIVVSPFMRTTKSLPVSREKTLWEPTSICGMQSLVEIANFVSRKPVQDKDPFFKFCLNNLWVF